MSFTVNLDSLGMQVDLLDGGEQRALINGMTTALLSSFKYLRVIQSKHQSVSNNTFYTAGTKILEITSGIYLSGHHKENHRRTIYYVTIEFAGLKSYDEKLDIISFNCLQRVAAYLNTNTFNFFYTSMDIAVDMDISFMFTYAFCNKRAAGVQYYGIYEPQPYATTQYIEKYNHTHTYVMKRSYLYDKGVKSGNSMLPLTRYELKLQPRFFNRYPYMGGISLQDELDRYHILCFSTLKEKEAVLNLLHDAYERGIRRRDLYKLGLDMYRIYPSVNGIENFLFSLYELYEVHLNLPLAVEANNGLEELLAEI